MDIIGLKEKKEIYRRIKGLSMDNASKVLSYAAFLIYTQQNEVSPEDEPNAETIAAIEESMNPDNLIECADIQDMFKKCGVKC